MTKEYRLCHREHGSEHTTCLTFRDWGGRQNWQGNETDDERKEAALAKMDEYKRFNRIYYGITDMWVEERDVSEWKAVDE